MRMVALGDLLQLADSGVWGDEAPNSGVSVLRSTNFNADGTLDLNKLTFRALDDRDRIRKLLKSGDILLEKSGGGPKQPVGRVALFRGDDRPHAFGNFIARLRPRDGILSEYLFYFLRHLHSTGKTTHYQKQTTGIRNLELKRFLAVPVPLVSLAEQQRIVDLLSRAEGIVRLRREAQKKAAEIIPALFFDMFGDPATNPKRWETRRLEDVLNSTKLGLVRGAKEMGQDKAFPYLRMDSIGEGTVCMKGLQKVDASLREVSDCSLRGGDLLFNTRNSRELVGKSGLVTETPTEPILFNNNLMRMRFDQGAFLPDFVNWQFQTAYVQRQLEAIKRGTTSVFAIYYKDLKNVMLVMPTLALQREFAKHVHRLVSVQLHQDSATIKAEAMFAALIGRTFGGGSAAFGTARAKVEGESSAPIAS